MGTTELVNKEGGGSRAAMKRKAAKLKAGSSESTPTSSKSSSHSDSDGKKKRKKDRDTSASNAIVSSKSPSSKKDHGIKDVEVWENDRDVSNLTFLDILELEEPNEVDATQRANMLMAKVLEPTSRQRFYTSNWETTPILIDRSSDSSHFKGLFSRKRFRAILQDYSSYYGIDVDVSKFNAQGNKSFVGKVIDNTDGNAATADASKVDSLQSGGDGDAVLAKVNDIWKCYEQGYSIRLLCPQKYDDVLWAFLSALEHEVGCHIGCDADLIPSGSQGYSPTVDGAESIILQITGESNWHIWKPNDGAELPLGYAMDYIPQDTTASQHATSSVGNSSSSNTNNADMDRILRAGDTLYIPRGWAYETRNLADMSSDDKPSLHLRLHTNRNNSVVDLLRAIVPSALETLAAESKHARTSLPRTYTNYLGIIHSDKEPSDIPLRDVFMAKSASVLTSVLNVALQMVDAGADQMAKKFISERLPVPLTSDEESRSSAGASDAKIFIYTNLRMLRPGIARALVEDDVCVVYHCMDNSRELYGVPIQPLEFDIDDGPAIEALLSAYPAPISVSNLPHPSEDDDDKIAVAQALFKEGFLIIDDDASKPTSKGDESEDSDDPF